MIARLSRLQRSWPLLQLVAVVAIFVYGNETIYGFSSSSSVNTMLVLAALLGLAALGQTLVMIIGGLDLSIPGFIVAGSIVPLELSRSLPFVVAILVTVAATALIGVTVGWATSRWQLQPLVLTLAVGSIVGGLAIVTADSGEMPAAPEWLAKLTSPAAQTFGLGFPPLVLVWALIAIAAAVVLHRTARGRRFFATGANPRAARLARVRTDRVAMAVFAVSACVSVLVGVLLAGFIGAGADGIGDPYLFQGLAAIIIGGTAFAGVRGDYSHTVLGALLVTEFTTVLIGKGVSGSGQQMLFGALILVVVALYGRQPRVRDRV